MNRMVLVCVIAGLVLLAFLLAHPAMAVSRAIHAINPSMNEAAVIAQLGSPNTRGRWYDGRDDTAGIRIIYEFPCLWDAPIGLILPKFGSAKLLAVNFFGEQILSIEERELYSDNWKVIYQRPNPPVK